MKKTSTAYVLWFFLGAFGAHKFYLNKTGMGVIYLFSLGLMGFGLLYDLFTMSSQVNACNALLNPPTPVYRGPIIQNNIITTGGAASTADELSKLKELRDGNVISNDEFESQKRKLMSV